MTMIPPVEVPETQAASQQHKHQASVSNQQSTKQAPGEDNSTASSRATLRSGSGIKSFDRRSTMTNHDDDLLQSSFLSKEVVAALDNKCAASTAHINLAEKSVIIHRDENGFGLRVKGQSPVFVERVHENGSAWRAGVRKYDLIAKVNGNSVAQSDHKEVVLMFKSCSRFVGLTLLSSATSASCLHLSHHSHHHQRQSSEGTINASTNQFHTRPATRTERRDTDEPLRHVREEATNEQQQLWCSCYQQQQLRRRRLLLASSGGGVGGSTKTLPSLKHQQQQQQQYQYQLSAAGKQEADDTQSEYHHRCQSNTDCSGRLRRSSHKLSLISSSSSSRHQHNSAAASLESAPATLLASNQCDCHHHKQQPPNDNNNNNTTTTTTTTTTQAEAAAMARRSESATKPPCHLSVPQSSCSAATTNGDTTICICLSCRQSLLQIAAEHQLQRRGRDAAEMDSCEQCRLMRSSASSRLSSTNNSKYRSTHQRDFQAQQQQQQTSSNKSVRQETPNQYTNKLCQSASTSSLPTAESHQQQQLQLQLQPNKNNTSQQQIPAAPTQRAPQTNKRLEIIRELIDTEKTHTDRLRCLDELFYRPLKTGGYMTSEQLRSVFSCHRTLYKIHRQIYRILLSVNYNLYPEPLIGSALIEIFEGDLKRRLERAACNFCASQSNNAELLNKLTRRDTKVGEFLAHVTSQQMVGRLGIKDLLASCFQRLTKYPLLLENLLKATPQAPPPLVSPARSGCQKNTLRRSRKVNSSIEADEEYGSQEADEDEEDDDEDGRQDGDTTEEDEHEAELRKAREDSHRMMAISLAEEREFIERALTQSRQMLIRVNDSVKVAFSHNKLKEIWKRTDKHPGVPLIDITKQQVVHEGLLTLRLAKRSFDVYVLLLNDYLIILTREGQDKYRLKFFTPDGKSASSSSGNNSSSNNSGQGSGVYSPVFVIDEHLTTRDAATDENGFYLLCKRKDDSRIYEFASRSPAERSRWRDKIQWTIERQMGKSDRRRSSCESAITKSSSEISSNRGDGEDNVSVAAAAAAAAEGGVGNFLSVGAGGDNKLPPSIREEKEGASVTSNQPVGAGANGGTLTKIEGTISLVEDDGIIQPHNMESTQAQVDQAVQVNICDRLNRPATTIQATSS